MRWRFGDILCWMSKEPPSHNTLTGLRRSRYQDKEQSAWSSLNASDSIAASLGACKHTQRAQSEGWPPVCTSRAGRKLQNMEHRICLKAKAAKTYASCIVCAQGRLISAPHQPAIIIFCSCLLYQVHSFRGFTSQLPHTTFRIQYGHTYQLQKPLSQDQGPNALHRASPDTCRNRISRPNLQDTASTGSLCLPISSGVTRTKDGLRISFRLEKDETSFVAPRC